MVERFFYKEGSTIYMEGMVIGRVFNRRGLLMGRTLWEAYLWRGHYGRPTYGEGIMGGLCMGNAWEAYLCGGQKRPTYGEGIMEAL